MCWGSNSYGQLGIGSTAKKTTPVSVQNLSGEVVVGVGAGRDHTCAIIRNGDVVMCWGYGFHGELGNGSTSNKNTPTSVTNLGGKVLALDVGNYNVCVIMNDGALKCWGDNRFGQIGDNTRTNRYTPTSTVNLGGPAVAVSLGDMHTCAIISGGTLKCWGRGGSYQLGIGSGFPRDRLTPTTVNLGGPAVAVSLGYTHTCAIINGGELKCWGYGDRGQLGDGSRGFSSTPASVTNLGGPAVAISLGWQYTCAIIDGGAMKCWGDGGYGQLGTWSTNTRLTPTPVYNLGGSAVEMSLGQVHTCAITTEGDLKCWGRGNTGQLGDGTTTTIPKTTPVYITKVTI